MALHLHRLKMITLEERRHIADIIFLYKIINDHISCPDLLALVTLNAPARNMRSRPLFVARLPKYRYYAIDPINRAMCSMNRDFSCVDPFLGSLTSVRTLLYKIVIDSHGDT